MKLDESLVTKVAEDAVREMTPDIGLVVGHSPEEINDGLVSAMVKRLRRAIEGADVPLDSADESDVFPRNADVRLAFERYTQEIAGH